MVQLALLFPLASNDNGADLVETSYMIMGLLTARQYFNGADAAETNLRNDINHCGMRWNGIGSGKMEKKFCTGTGVPIPDWPLMFRYRVGMNV